MRKHFYLITEHETDGHVGGVITTDSRKSRPNKNEEAPITVLDEDTESFREVGKQVGLGYHDFESEAKYDDNKFLASVMHAKIRSVDRHWAAKAGVEDTAYEQEIRADGGRTEASNEAAGHHPAACPDCEIGDVTIINPDCQRPRMSCRNCDWDSITGNPDPPGHDELATDGGQAVGPIDQTHVDSENGLWVPSELRDASQIVFRTPRATVQSYGDIGAYHEGIDASHFGAADEFDDVQNPELVPDMVSIKPAGEDARQFAVEIHPDIVADGGHERGSTEWAERRALELIDSGSDSPEPFIDGQKAGVALLARIIENPDAYDESNIKTDGGVTIQPTTDTDDTTVTDDYIARIREQAAAAREADPQPVGALLFELEAALHELSTTYHTGGELGECYDALESIFALQLRLWWAMNDGDLQNPAIEGEEGFADE
jgi:hypothetical protein